MPTTRCCYDMFLTLNLISDDHSHCTFPGQTLFFQVLSATAVISSAKEIHYDINVCRCLTRNQTLIFHERDKSLKIKLPSSMCLCVFINDYLTSQSGTTGSLVHYSTLCSVLNVCSVFSFSFPILAEQDEDSALVPLEVKNKYI